MLIDLVHILMCMLSCLKKERKKVYLTVCVHILAYGHHLKESI